MESRLFEGFVENMPPANTPVTIIFKPKVTKKAAADPEATKWMQDLQKDKGGMKSGADSVFRPPGQTMARRTARTRRNEGGGRQENSPQSLRAQASKRRTLSNSRSMGNGLRM